MKIRFLGTIFAFLFFTFFASNQPVDAMGSGSLNFLGADCSDPSFTYFYIKVELNSPLTDDDGAGNDFIGNFAFDDTQSWRYAGQVQMNNFSTYPVSNVWTVGVDTTTTTTVEFVLADIVNYLSAPFDYATVTSYPVLAKIVVDVAKACAEPYVPSETILPPDSRINWQYGDLNAVLYHGSDEAGNPSLNLYCYNGETSWLGFSVNSDNMNDAPIRAEGCNAVFYVLDNGQLQINITDPEGKLYTIVCDDLACAAPSMSYFDPNE